jgi:hypothetical protein
VTCDVCGLPDSYRGQGDGIGSCDCPRCDCGSARGSDFCTCEPDYCVLIGGDGEHCPCWQEGGTCCGCGMAEPDDDEPWPDDVIARPVVTVEIPGVSR